MTKSRLLTAATAATLFLACSPANALSVRAWVSSHGADAAGCGSPASPCRSFQYVHDNIIAAGGEIDVLDPAGYGAVTITKALSIVNDGVGTAGVQQGNAAANAIAINAGSSDKVTLRGLNIDGLGIADNGIVFNSGGSLTVANCVVRHFHFGGEDLNGGNGILIEPTSGSVSVVVANTLVTDNDRAGVLYHPPSGSVSASMVIDHVTATNNGADGMYINAFDSSGGSVNVVVSESISSNNLYAGLDSYANSTQIYLTIDNLYANNNKGGGVEATGPVKTLLSRSIITQNNQGIINDTYQITNQNQFYTYGDNRVNDNNTDLSGAALIPVSLR